MKQKNILMGLASLAVAAVIGGSLTSCDDKVKPSITDANGDKWQVTSFGGYYFTYDGKGRLLSIGDKDRTYFMDDDEFSFSAEDVEVKFKLDKNDNIVKIVYTEQNDDKYEAEEGQFDFTYDSDKKLKSCKTVYKETDLKDSETWTFTSTTNFTWTSNQLTINNEETVQGNDDGENVRETQINTRVYSCDGQPNRSKQLPYYIGEQMTDLNDFGGMLAVLGLFGFGPDNLPTADTWTRNQNGKEIQSDGNEFDFVQNANGTLQSESYRYKGSSIWYTKEYIYSRTRADFVATQSLIDLVRSSMHKIALKHREQKQ